MNIETKEWEIQVRPSPALLASLGKKRPLIGFDWPPNEWKRGIHPNLRKLRTRDEALEWLGVVRRRGCLYRIREKS